MEINFSRRPSKDERDQGYLMKRLLAPAGTVLPTSKKWAIAARNLDQTDYGICVGAAWTNFLRCAPVQSTGTIELAFKIYDAAIAIDEWPDNDSDTDRQMGTSVRAGADVVTQMKRLKSYLWAFQLQPAVEWVLTKGPVVLGTTWYDSMMRPDSAGMVQIKPRARAVGGHAYLWRGADTRKGLAYCCNSWGDDWGLSGNFIVPFRDLEILIHDEGEACTAVQQSLRALAVK